VSAKEFVKLHDESTVADTEIIYNGASAKA
jgi:hypothetical protein